MIKTEEEMGSYQRSWVEEGSQHLLGLGTQGYPVAPALISCDASASVSSPISFPKNFWVFLGILPKISRPPVLKPYLDLVFHHTNSLGQLLALFRGRILGGFKEEFF